MTDIYVIPAILLIWSVLGVLWPIEEHQEPKSDAALVWWAAKRGVIVFLPVLFVLVLTTGGKAVEAVLDKQWSVLPMMWAILGMFLCFGLVVLAAALYLINFIIERVINWLI